jgi:hypothetical protein
MLSPASVPGFFRLNHSIAVLLVLWHCVDSSGAESFDIRQAEPQRQTIELGRDTVFCTTLDIADVRVADARLCSAVVIGNDRKELAVTGLCRGSTTITVWFNRPGTTTQTYIVDVVTAQDAYLVLEQFIAGDFPTSSIKFTPVPTSQKVIVSGTATSCDQWHQIQKIIDRGGIRCEDLIVRVKILRCCPCGR